MATAKELELDDITECPVCTQMFADPRVLSCGHTYCLKCMKALSKNKQPGDKLACPLCRKKFIVPDSGIGSLPRNYVVGNFIQLQELSSVGSKKSHCETCSTGEGSGSRIHFSLLLYLCQYGRNLTNRRFWQIRNVQLNVIRRVSPSVRVAYLYSGPRLYMGSRG